MKREPEYYRDPEAEAKELREELAEKALTGDVLEPFNEAGDLLDLRATLEAAIYHQGDRGVCGLDTDQMLGEIVRKLFEDYYTPIVISEMQRRK